MSNCSIDTDFDDYGSVTLRQVVCKARKQHRCGECGRVINKGESYEAYNGVCEGDFFWAKTCSDCLSLRNSFFKGGFMFGGVRDEIHNYISDVSGDVEESCIVNLTDNAKEFVFEAIEKEWV